MSGILVLRAADLMRERAENATEGPWRCDPESKRDSRPADCYDVLPPDTIPVVASIEHADARHIASWNPFVAVAVANWLTRVAETWWTGSTQEEIDALTVAVAYLEGES